MFGYEPKPQRDALQNVGAKPTQRLFSCSISSDLESRVVELIQVILFLPGNFEAHFLNLSRK